MLYEYDSDQELILEVESEGVCVSDNPLPSVQGRLKCHSSFWLKELEPSSFVGEVITKGYRLPFLRYPEPVFCFNHKSAVRHAEFVMGEIQRLVDSCCVAEVPDCPIVCSPLSVVVNHRGKKRLVLDLRYVNQFLLLQKFKYEGLDLVPQMFSKGDYFFTFDLKSGYHHVDIHPDCWPYLGFSWEHDGSRSWYIFKVLPFGLASACYVFTKLLRPLVKRWRSKGLKAIIYIDDGICAASNAQDCAAARDLMLSDLSDAGFILSVEKCRLEPAQVGEWLGFTLDLGAGSVSVPIGKMSALQTAIGALSLDVPVHARTIASIVGKIISMGLAVGPIARLRTRALYSVVNEKMFWSDMLPLSDEAKLELTFWKSCLPFFNGQPIWFDSGVTRVVYSDASSTGYGGYIVEIGPSVSHGHWSQQEAGMSSTWRELKAVYSVLQSFATRLKGHTVKWFSDNQNVVRIVQVGSAKEHLQDGAMCIFETCLQFAIKLEMEWIPRGSNEIADYISRIVDVDDWQVAPSLFRTFDEIWGPHTVDRFASPYNSQLKRFNSKFWSPRTEAIDAFTVHWAHEVNWWVPPIYLIVRTIRHAEKCQAMGTLVVPVWKSALFWPILYPDGRSLARFVHEWSIVVFTPELIITGRSGHNLGSSLTSESQLLFLWLDFSVSPRSSDLGFSIDKFCG